MDAPVPLATDTDAKIISDPSPLSSVTLYTFNKCYAELVLVLKKSNPIVKAALAHYKVMDNLSTLRDHVNHLSDNFVKACPKAVEMLLDVKETPLSMLADKSEILETTPVRGINMLAIKTTALSSPSTKDLFWSTLSRVLSLYVLLLSFEEEQQQHAGEETGEKNVQSILQTLSQVRQLAAEENVSDGGDADANAVAGLRHREQTVLEVAQQQLPALSDSEKTNQAMNAVLRLFQCERESKVASSKTETASRGARDSGAAAGGKKDGTDLKDMLEGSKIGRLVAEMLEEFDPAELNLGLEQQGGGLFDSQNPLDAFANIQNLMRPESGIGGTVSKLGNKLQQKIGSGEICVQELLGEAMGLIGNNDALRNNPLIAQLMASFTQQQTSHQDGGIGGLAQLFSGLSGSAESSGTSEHNNGSSEKNLEKLFADLETAAMRRGNGSSNASRHSHQTAASGTSVSSTKDRLRKKYESKHHSKK